MSNSRSQRMRGQHEKIHRMGKLTERSASFHGKSPVSQSLLRRPKTDPDLLSGTKKPNGGGGGGGGGGGMFSSSSSLTANEQTLPRRLTKLLLNVTIQRSLGPVHVIMSPESTVGDLIATVVKQYIKEGRRPTLSTTDPSKFSLHYSQFSLESLDRQEKLIELGSRNFFLCRPDYNKNVATAAAAAGAASSSNPCSNQVEKVSKNALPWFRFIELLL